MPTLGSKEKTRAHLTVPARRPLSEQAEVQNGGVLWDGMEEGIMRMVQVLWTEANLRR